MSRERGGGGQEPGLVLGLGQDNAYGTIRPALPGTVQQPGGELCRTIVVRIQEHQNATVRPGSTSGERNRALQLLGFQNLVALHPDGSGNFQCDARDNAFGDSSEQDGNRLYFSVAFDDGRNPVCRHGLEPNSSSWLAFNRDRAGSGSS